MHYQVVPELQQEVLEVYGEELLVIYQLHEHVVVLEHLVELAEVAEVVLEHLVELAEVVLEHLVELVEDLNYII